MPKNKKICHRCGHPTNKHGISGCAHLSNGRVPKFDCDCTLTPENIEAWEKHECDSGCIMFGCDKLDKTVKEMEEKDPQQSLKSILALAKDEKENGECFNCGKNNNQSCGYGEWTSTTDGQDFDRIAPDGNNLECPCYHTWCDKCQASKNGLKAMLKAIFGDLNNYYEKEDIVDDTIEVIQKWINLGKKINKEN